MAIWFLSDHHFNHNNILKFKDDEGNLYRPEFRSVEEMNETLIEKHNSVVSKGDKVYFGGDVGLKAKDILKRLNGRKRLILGNHDDRMTLDDFKIFEKVLMWRFFGHLSDPFILSHVPLHPSSLRNCYNVHGHTHKRHIMLDNKKDKRYYNICCENHNYTPIELEDLIKRIKNVE